MTEFLLSLGWDTADVYLTYGLGWGIQKNHFKTVCVLEGDWSISPWHIVLLQKNKNTNKNEQKNLHQIYKLRVQSSALVFYLPWKASSSAMQQPVIMLGVFFLSNWMKQSLRIKCKHMVLNQQIILCQHLNVSFPSLKRLSWETSARSAAQNAA